MFVRVTDLCGREAPYITDEAELDEFVREALDECDGFTCYLGEVQYDYLDRDDPEVVAYLATCD